MFTNGEKITVSLAQMWHASSLFPRTNSVPAASLAEVLNLIQGFANDTQLYTSFSPNNDLELADTFAKFQDTCET